MTIGQRITKLRKRRGWTQEMFADKAGVHARHVSRWETDRMKPSGRTLKRLADLFGVSLDELLGENESGAASPSLASLDGELL
jgi:transcriptional regulator with XRE-family HTH domain